MNLIKPKPTTYKNILFRSRLEAKWAVLLDNIHNSRGWEYEPITLVGPEGIEYVPDFFVRLTIQGDDYGFFLEVKPAPVSTDFDLHLLKMFRVQYTSPKESNWPQIVGLILLTGNIYHDCTVTATHYVGKRRRKLDDRAIRGIFDGFDDAYNAAICHRFDLAE